MNRENLCTIFADLSTKMPARAGNSWCVFTVWLEPILSKTAERNQTKEASPPPLAGTRHPPPPAEPSSRWRRRLFQIQKFPILQFVRIVFVSFVVIIPPLSVNINDNASKHFFVAFLLLLFDIFRSEEHTS